VDTALVGTGIAPAADDSGNYVAANVTGLYAGSENVLPWSQAVPPSPPSNDIINLGLDGDYVYVNSNGAGVGRFDGHDWKLWLPRSCGTCDTTLVDPSFPFALLVDREHRKWIGAWGVAMEFFDDLPDSLAYRHLWRDAPDKVKHTWGWASAQDVQGGHWFGMDTPCLGGDPVSCDPLGLDYYDADGVFIRSYNAGNTPGFRFNKVHSLTVDDVGNVWMGFSPDGVMWFRPPTPTPSDSSYNITLNPVDAVPPTSFVEGLVAHGADIWVLSDKGLLRVDRQNPENLLATHALPGGVNKIGLRPLDIGPDGTVWAGTESGVRAFYANGDSEDFTTANSPLLDNSVRAICVDHRTGVLWFGTGGGLSRYDPHYVPPPSAPPTLEVKIFPNPVMITTGGLSLRLGKRLASDAGGIYRGAVYDIGGRKMRTFEVDLTGAVPQVFWNGRDSSGNLVRSGIYFVRVEAGGRACTVRVALVR
jgi:hypothetical protein